MGLFWAALTPCMPHPSLTHMHTHTRMRMCLHAHVCTRPPTQPLPPTHTHTHSTAAWKHASHVHAHMRVPMLGLCCRVWRNSLGWCHVLSSAPYQLSCSCKMLLWRRSADRVQRSVNKSNIVYTRSSTPWAKSWCKGLRLPCCNLLRGTTERCDCQPVEL